MFILITIAYFNSVLSVGSMSICSEFDIRLNNPERECEVSLIVNEKEGNEYGLTSWKILSEPTSKNIKLCYDHIHDGGELRIDLKTNCRGIISLRGMDIDPFETNMQN